MKNTFTQSLTGQNVVTSQRQETEKSYYGTGALGINLSKQWNCWQLFLRKWDKIEGWRKTTTKNNKQNKTKNKQAKNKTKNNNKKQQQQKKKKKKTNKQQQQQQQQKNKTKNKQNKNNPNST